MMSELYVNRLTSWSLVAVKERSSSVFGTLCRPQIRRLAQEEAQSPSFMVPVAEADVAYHILYYQGPYLGRS